MNSKTINDEVECRLLKTSSKAGEMVIKFSSSAGYKSGDAIPEKWIEIARRFMKGNKGYNRLDLVRIYCQRPTASKDYIQEIFVGIVQ